MLKKCVFCGEKPESKNNEHIIPQWLIKFTGNANRSFYLGTGWIKGSSARNYSADQFQFPACRRCNEKYSDFEAAASIVFHKLFDSEKISVIDIDLLLDWFDKVRVGLWLGYRYLEKDYFGIDPKFYIDSRIGLSDRVLFVYHLSDEFRGILFNGANSPVFFFMPSCFLLSIKDLAFINISDVFLISRRVGFRYPQGVNSDHSGNQHIKIGEPLERIIKPILRYQFKEPDYAFFQPIVPLEWGNDALSDNDYIQSHLLNAETNKGKIILMRDGFSRWMSEEDEVEIKPLHKAMSVEKSFTIIKTISMQVYQYQLRLYENNILTGYRLTNSDEWKRMVIDKYNVRKLQNTLIDAIKKTPPDKVFPSKNEFV